MCQSGLIQRVRRLTGLIDFQAHQLRNHRTDVLERHVVKRDSTKELAKERSISATAMGRQLQRARQRLRTVLERDTGHC
ncbi:MAG: hypothetical protein RLZZ216_347 [Cyanobacteriota bacterium]